MGWRVAFPARSDAVQLRPFKAEVYPHLLVMASFVLPEDPVDLGDLVQGQGAPPEDGWAGRPIMLAAEVATESRHPGDDLPQGRWLRGQFGRAVDAAVQDLPLDRGQ